MSHEYFCQSTVSFPKTGDLVKAASKISTAKRLSPEEAADRRARGLQHTHYRGCTSVIEYKESGHTLIPQSAFSLRLWSTHREISANLELYIRPLTGTIFARRGVLAPGFLDGCHNEIQSAVWSTLPSRTNINQHHFEYE